MGWIVSPRLVGGVSWPGVMGTDWLDGETAERVRAVAAQWSLQGLEETEGT
jgi:hypothetical protein